MAKFLFDASRSPIVVITYPQVFDVADIDQYFDDLRAVIARDVPYLIVNDLRAMGLPDDPTFARRAAAFMQESDEATARLCRGAANVTDSVLVRGALTSLLWLFKPPHPYVIMSNLADAMSWVESRVNDDDDGPVER